jgi:hypothetical protein
MNDDFTRGRAAFLARAAELSQKERDHARLSFLDELRRSPMFTPAAKLVGWEIVQCVDEELGYAWPKEETLAEWLNIDERTVVRAVNDLERVSVILVERIRRRVHHYVAPYFWSLTDKLSLQHTAGASGGATKMPPGGDKDVPRKGDKDAPLTALKNPDKFPESAGSQRNGVGSTLAAGIATDLWRIAQINIHALTQRRRCEQISEVQSWLDAGWEADVIRMSALDQMKGRRTSEPIISLKIFKPKLEIHYTALSVRRMAG